MNKDFSAIESNDLFKVVKSVVSFGLLAFCLLSLAAFKAPNSITSTVGYYVCIRTICQGFLDATTYIFEAVLIGLVINLLTVDAKNIHRELLPTLILVIQYLYPIMFVVDACKTLPKASVSLEKVATIPTNLLNIGPLILFIIVVEIFCHIQLPNSNKK